MDSTSQFHLQHLLNTEWDPSTVLQWLKEDIPTFDYGGYVVGTFQSNASLLFILRVLHGVNFVCLSFGRFSYNRMRSKVSIFVLEVRPGEDSKEATLFCMLYSMQLLVF